MKSLFSLFIVCASSALVADIQPPPRSSATPPPAYPEGVASQPRGTITPPVAPKVQNGVGADVAVDFLWWKAQLDGMSFANVNGKVKSPPENFEAGFRVGAGLDLGYDGWDAKMEYTWVYQPWLTSSFTAGANSFGRFAFPDTHDDVDYLTVPSLASGKSSRKVQYNVIDFELGRDFFISKQLTMRPFVGFKFARMLEKTTVEETGARGTNFTSLNLYFQQTLSSFGIRGGMDTMWHLSRNFGLYGDLALTNLWGSFHNNTSHALELHGDTVNVANKGRSITIIPVVEFGFGLAYMAWFNNDSCQFVGKAGWEEQVWVGYNHNDINNLMNPTGNLSLQGLKISAGLSF